MIIENPIPEKNTLYNSKASTFILPMTGYAFREISGAVNCYIADFEQTSNELNFNKIFLLTTKENLSVVKSYHFFKEYRTKDNKFMYVFHIPEEFVPDYKKFLDGKYSTFSDAYKNVLISKITRPEVQTSQIYKILYKTEEARKTIENRIGQKLPPGAEVLSAIRYEDETYMYDLLLTDALIAE